jgi:predicted TIM-barrel fold metal-dependent hydrolase
MRRLPIRPKFVKAGVKNVCVHKGLFPPSVEKSVPNLRGYVDVSDVGQAAKDWPQLNFVIYHSGYRYVGDLNIDPALALAEFEEAFWIQFFFEHDRLHTRVLHDMILFYHRVRCRMKRTGYARVDPQTPEWRLFLRRRRI